MQLLLRTRLQLHGVDDAQIEAVLEAGEANSHVKIRSPIGGHVIRKYVQEGQYVDEGTPLYDVAGSLDGLDPGEVY